MTNVGSRATVPLVPGCNVPGVLLAFLLIGWVSLAHAATFTVDSTADAVDTNPGNGICASVSGSCTLRAAIMEANALAGADTITLPTGTYNLTIPGANEDAAATGDLDITADLTINGAGTTIVDGNGAALFDRVFHILAGTVTISSITITGGNNIFGAGGGGGVANAGTLTLNSSIVSSNIGFGGGGICNLGTVTLNTSTVSGNTSSGNSNGGGIFNVGTATLYSSTVSGNSNTGGGGGISNGGTLTLNNTTVSGNSAANSVFGAGGGILNSGTMTVTNSTVSDNSAGSGGGISVAAGAATLKNTIVANSPSGGNCVVAAGGTLASNGHNLSSDATCAFAGLGDLNSTNPLLGSLALNAPGTTRTHALLAGSPAIDAGDNIGCPSTDQRGVARPQGLACDIGAYEAASTATLTRTATPTRTPTRTATIVRSEICGIKFNDLNGNGMYEPQLGEPGLAGWTINLVFGVPPNVVDLQATTDANGNYCFTGLAPGTYNVSETLQPGWAQTFPAPPGTYTVTVPPSVTTINFGNKVAPTPTRTPTKTSTPTVTPGCVQPPAGIVAWWPLNTPTPVTFVDDIWTFNNNGTVVGPPLWGAGWVNGAFQFNGASNYIDVPSAPSLNFGPAAAVPPGDFSIDAWIMLPQNAATANVRSIVDKRQAAGSLGYQFYLFNRQISLQLADTTFTNYNSTFAIPADGRWHHIAVTVERNQNSGIRFYSDGAPAGVTGNPLLHPGTLVNSNNLRIGAQLFGDEFLDGWLDEVQIFNRALSPSDIRAIFDAQQFGKCTATPSPTPTPTASKTRTASVTPTRTRTATPTPTRPATPTFTRTPSATPTRTRTATVTVTRSPTATSTATPTGAPCASPPPCMVAWWPLNETGGTLIDDIWFNNLDGTSLSANGVPAPVSLGGPSSVAGQQVGNSLYFAGEYVEANYPQLDFGAGELSIDAWVKVNGVPNPSPTPGGPASETIQPIVDKTSQIGGIAKGYALFLHYASAQPFQLGFVIDDGVAPATTYLLHPAPLLVGWYHVAVTVARPTAAQAVVTLYVDALPFGPTTLAVGSTSNTEALWVGKSRLHALLNAPFFQEGTIDELEIFNCALTQPDIQHIYSAQQSGKCTPTPGATATPTAPPTPSACVGDCDGDGVVTVNEIIVMVNIALGTLPLSACTAGDANSDGTVDITEILTAVFNFFNGCPCGFVGPRMCGGRCPNSTDVCQPLPDDSGCACRPGGPIPTATASTTRTATPTVTERSTATPSRTPTRTATPPVMPTTCVPTPPNMVAWWKLDEPPGAPTVVDIGLPLANNGVPRPGPFVGPPGGPQSVPGNLLTNPPDGALLFDVPTTYVEVLSASPDLDLANSDLTIDAWIRPTEVHPVLRGVVDVVEPIVDKLGSGNTKGYALYLQIRGTCPTCPPSPQAPPPGTVQGVEMHLVFAVGNGISTSFYSSNSIYTGTFTVAAAPPLNPPWPDWMHLTVEVNRTAGNMGTFYLNGSHLDSVDSNGNPMVSFSPVAGIDDSSASFWIGGTRLFPIPIGIHGEIEINELEVFNVPLSPADIQSIADAPGGKCKGTPVATSTATSPRSPTPTATRSFTPSFTPTRIVDVVTRTPTRTSSPTSTFTRTPSRTSTASFTPRTVTSTPTATPPCEEPRSLLVSTGNASIGGNDPLWSLTGAPVGIPNFPPARPAIVISAYGGWSTLSGTQWITAVSVCGQTTGCPAGTYEYELCWRQCGELVDVAPFMALADNRANVFLDNNFLIAVPGFSIPTSFSFNAGPGAHSLRVDVVNDLFSGVQTPTGLDLSGILNGQIQIVECPVRPPTFTATPSSTAASATPTRTPTRTATSIITASFTPAGCPGGMCTLTPTRTPTSAPGSNITILKNTDPDGPQDFTFTATGGLVPSTFMLDDDTDPTLANAQTFTNVPAGTYTITEMVPAGWMVTSIGCVGAVGVSTGISSATITVQAGANVTCTFKNVPRPTPTTVPTRSATSSRPPTATATRTPTRTPMVPPPD